MRTVNQVIRENWHKFAGRIPLIAFSGGKDSLFLLLVLKRLLKQKAPWVVHVHWPLQHPSVAHIVQDVRRITRVLSVTPLLTYEDAIQKGLAPISVWEPWCKKVFLAVGFWKAFSELGAESHSQCLLIKATTSEERGNHKIVEWDADLRCLVFNPLLQLTRKQIVESLAASGWLPDIYPTFRRSYCLFCYSYGASTYEKFKSLHPQLMQRIEGLLEKINRLKPRLKFENRDELGHLKFSRWSRTDRIKTIGCLILQQDGSSLFRFVSTRALKNALNCHILTLINPFTYRIDQRTFFVPTHFQPIAKKAVLMAMNCVQCGYCLTKCYRGFKVVGRRFVRHKCNRCFGCIAPSQCIGWKFRTVVYEAAEVSV